MAFVRFYKLILLLIFIASNSQLLSLDTLEAEIPNKELYKGEVITKHSTFLKVKDIINKANKNKLLLGVNIILCVILASLVSSKLFNLSGSKVSDKKFNDVDIYNAALQKMCSQYPNLKFHFPWEYDLDTLEYKGNVQNKDTKKWEIETLKYRDIKEFIQKNLTFIEINKNPNLILSEPIFYEKGVSSVSIEGKEYKFQYIRTTSSIFIHPLLS